jgi:hypothetical protein
MVCDKFCFGIQTRETALDLNNLFDLLNVKSRLRMIITYIVNGDSTGVFQTPSAH